MGNPACQKEVLMVTLVTTYPGMQYRVFLAVANGIGFLLNVDANNPLCPCCLSDEHRRDIMKALYKAMFDKQVVEGRIRWVSGNSKYGEQVGRYGFPQGFFCHATMEEVPTELLEEVRNYAQ